MNFDSLMPMITQYGARVVGVLVLLWVAGTIGKWARKKALRGFEKAKFEPTLARFFANMLRWVILVVAIVAILGIFGIETASFAAVFAAAGFAVGLAFQGTLSNFSAGVMLLIFRPFAIGQVVNVAGVLGKVVEIGLFTTTFDTPDNRRIIVPNGAIFGATIENISHHETRRVDVAVGVEYSAPIDKTREVLLQAAKKVEGGLADPEPAIVLGGLGDSAVDWTVRLWCKAADYWAVRDALTRQVKLELDEAGLGIPFPQMDLHVVDMPAKAAAS
jgi:small conductance mechanosensitive channel